MCGVCVYVYMYRPPPCITRLVWCRYRALLSPTHPPNPPDTQPNQPKPTQVEAVKQSWRTIILSRGKQGAKAMREFYRDLHKAHPDLEEKVR